MKEASLASEFALLFGQVISVSFLPFTRVLPEMTNLPALAARAVGSQLWSACATVLNLDYCITGAICRYSRLS